MAVLLGREKSPPVAVGSAPEPWLNRAVAFRPHQVRPARGAWDDHNSDLGLQPEEAIGSENMSPVVHRRDRVLFRTTSPALQWPHRAVTRGQTACVLPDPNRIPSRGAR